MQEQDKRSSVFTDSQKQCIVSSKDSILFAFTKLKEVNIEPLSVFYPVFLEIMLRSLVSGKHKELDATLKSINLFKTDEKEHVKKNITEKVKDKKLKKELLRILDKI